MDVTQEENNPTSHCSPSTKTVVEATDHERFLRAFYAHPNLTAEQFTLLLVIVRSHTLNLPTDCPALKTEIVFLIAHNEQITSLQFSLLHTTLDAFASREAKQTDDDTTAVRKTTATKSTEEIETSLTFSDDFNRPLSSDMFPHDSVTHLTFGHWFNQPLGTKYRVVSLFQTNDDLRSRSGSVAFYAHPSYFWCLFQSTIRYEVPGR